MNINIKNKNKKNNKDKKSNKSNRTNKIKTYQIDKNQLIGKRPVGCVLGSDGDNNRYEYRNIVISYIDGERPILIKTNLSQNQWDAFCDGNLSRKELEMCI